MSTLTPRWVEMTMTLAQVLTAFDDVRQERDGYVARCPAHPDRNPSLRIALTESGRVMLYCRAGCETEDVVEAAGLSWSQLFDVDGAGAVATRAGGAGAPDVALLAPLGAYVERCAGRLTADTPVARQAVDYLERRYGLCLDEAAQWRLGLDDGSDEYEWLDRAYRRVPRLVVPLCGFDGVARGVQARDITDTARARWCGLSNPPGVEWARFGVFTAGGEWVTLTEGPSDALTSLGAGYDTVFLRGAGIARNGSVVAEIGRALADRQIVLAGDRDRAGQQFNVALADGLAAVRPRLDVRTLVIPRDGADLTDWRETDPDRFPATMRAAVRAAQAARGEPQTAPAGPAAPAGADTSPTALPPTELRTALRIEEDMDGRVVHDPSVGYLAWDGNVWRPATAKMRHRVHRDAVALQNAAGELPEGRERDTATRYALAAQRSRFVDGTLTELAARVDGSIEDFDQRPDLLACSNGTVDLQSGLIRAADPADRLTVALDYEYDPKARAPRFERFLAEAFPDQPDMPAYLQRLVGYGITGHANEHCFVLLHGSGSNGKSVFTTALYDAFAPITANVGIETFLYTPGNGGGPSSDVAALRGRRLVLTSESEHGARFAEARLKRLTGGDPVTARHLYRPPFTFVPSFLLIVSTNGLPEIRGTDDGIWRRIKVINWNQHFNGDRQDRRLSAALREERAGILAWSVRGAFMWYQNGLGEPPSVAQAVQEYREESDKLAEFYPGILEGDPDGFMTRADVYQAYADWCDEQGTDRNARWRNHTLFSALRAAGVEPVKRSHSRGFRLRQAERSHTANPFLRIVGH